MTVTSLTAIGFIILLASVLQGSVGFGLSLFATPLLVWSGLRLSEAVAIVSVAVSFQVLAGTLQLRCHVRWREVLHGTAIRYLCIPLGIWLLLKIDLLERDRIKQVIGVLVLAAVLMQLLWPVNPRERLHRAWTIVAFAASGLMQGLAAMGGPPAVLWVMAHRWSSQEVRAFLLALFLLASPLQISLLYLSAGQSIAAALWTGLVLAPLVIAGSVAGVRLGNRISRDRLQQAALAVLFVTAVVSILAPVF